MSEKQYTREEHTLNISLIYAAKNGDYELAKEMLSRGADVHFKENLALVSACKMGDISSAKLLVDAGASVSGIYESKTLLYFAINSRNFDLVAFLIESGADVNENDSAAISCACVLGDKRLATLLLENGAAPTPGALWFAITQKEYDIAELLVFYGIDPHHCFVTQDEEGAAAESAPIYSDMIKNRIHSIRDYVVFLSNTKLASASSAEQIDILSAIAKLSVSPALIDDKRGTRFGVAKKYDGEAYGALPRR